VTQSGGSKNLTYDANGNLTSDGTKTYDWNADDRLVAVSQGATTLASFTYDGYGRRAQKIAGGVTTTYVYTGDQLVEERPSTGGTLRYWHGPWLDDILAKQDTTGAAFYYAKDHLGSVRQVTNAAGVAVVTRDYDPWGKLLTGSSSAGYAFTGREWDSESGLHYYRARYYDPSLGRFLSEDPIGHRGGPNFYAYVGNAPTNHLDPFGLARWRIPCSDAEIKRWKDECQSRGQRLEKIQCWRVENQMLPAAGGRASFSISFGYCTASPEKPCKDFDPKKKENQEDPEWRYRWHEEAHDKRGGGPHWDRGHKLDGERQQWSPDGTTWHDK